MSKRGWKYRCYADEPKTPVADFVCALLGGATGFYGLIGWVLVSWEIASPLWTGILCIANGLFFGVWLMYEEKEDAKNGRILHESRGHPSNIP